MVLSQKNSNQRRNATLVVIEFSAVWPKWLKPDQFGDMAVVAQHYEGEPGSLVAQVASRTTRLEAVGWQLQTIVLVSNGRSDRDARASRSILARGLLARLKAMRSGELVLTVDDMAGKRAASDLWALVAALKPSIQGSGVELAGKVGKRTEWLSEEPLSGMAQAS
jgi:hypothetical protein